MAYDRLSELAVYRLYKKNELLARVRYPSLDGQLLIHEAAPVLRHANLASLRPTEIKAVQKLVRAFVGSVVEWSLLVDGKPAPVTAKALGAHDPEFVADLVLSWLRVIKWNVRGADVPSQTSSSVRKGTTPPEAPSPQQATVDPEMEAFSERLANLPVHLTKPPGEVAASA